MTGREVAEWLERVIADDRAVLVRVVDHLGAAVELRERMAVLDLPADSRVEFADLIARTRDEVTRAELTSLSNRLLTKQGETP